MSPNSKFLILILIILSLTVHFIFFNHPAEVVFDEVHFSKFVSWYFSKEYFFDVHPPLGKLLIAGFTKIIGLKPNFFPQNITDKFLDSSYKWLRFLPKLSGALLSIVIFFIAQQLNFSKNISFLISLFVVFENALITQSRFILIDTFLLLFGSLSILFYFSYFQKNNNQIANKNIGNLFLAGLFASMAFSIKWTGLVFVGVILLLYFIFWIKSEQKFRNAINGLIFLIFIPIVIYFFIFVVHFSILNKSGSGDGFHSPQFQKTLIGNRYQNDPEIKPLNILAKFWELNIKMYKANTGITATHPFSSKWYKWPFMIKPIYFWNKIDQGKRESRIYLIGNPVVWFLGTIAIIYLTIYFIKDIFFRKFKSLDWKAGAILFGYWLNLIPFVFINRVVFLYHYFPSLIFSILSFGYIANKKESVEKVIPIIILIVILSFIFISPLTYGLKEPKNYFDLITWLKM
jgi:dolichyl-phosphate-mannose-protein mannosyltransferase